MKEAIVLYPSPGIGHLISMVELGKLILNHNPSFSIEILITPPPYNAGSTEPYINRVSQTTPSISFHHLPTISLALDSTDSAHHETILFELHRLNNPNVHFALESISRSSTVRSLIIDFFCFSVLEISQKLLEIPTFFFFTSNASCLSLYMYFPKIYETFNQSFKDLKTHLSFPGFPPISAVDMPKPLLDRTDDAYLAMIELSEAFTKSRGIIVNTFESLEPRAVKALTDGLAVPVGATPPIYYIGPLISDRVMVGGESGKETGWLTWLDSQPSRSVVFLSFGSLGLFGSGQLSEIAVGLEKSGQRFLWVVRNPPTDEKLKTRLLAGVEPDLETLLPNGFLDRTKDRGLVVKSWVPQVEVLGHESVGGFVTHCGWNSVLESVCAGVPMVAWPLYAEQRLNKVLLVEELKLALSVDESEDGFVSSDEVEKRVNELMDSTEGRAIKERVMKAKEDAKAAMSEGGSSRRALAELIDSWFRG